jgi:hypothetical protein
VSKIVTINDVALAFLGVSLSRLPSDSALPDVPLINIKDIENGVVVLPDQLAKVKYPGQSQQRLCAGDVLVSIRGTLLKTAIVREAEIGALASGNLAILRPKAGMILPEVLQAVLLSKTTQAEILSQTTGSVIKGLQIGTIKRVSFTLPTMSTQENLAALVRLSDEQRRLAIKLASDRRDLALAVIARHFEAK